MEKLKTLLVANRGEVAVRIIRTARAKGIKTIAVYSSADAGSAHVTAADDAVLLAGGDTKAYLDGQQLLRIATDKAHACDAVIPGYGFLSENADFARQVREAGLAWCGPSPEAIEAFGVKHVARELAQKAGVPVVPGTKGLVDDADAAVKHAEELGFPVMIKATSGGGGMGLVVCGNAEEVRKGFETTTSRAQTLFKNPGVFIERYYPASRHIEVQIFGNGAGKAVHFGERECSIQRRHQKVIEECPSPFVTKHPHLREKMGACSVSLAESVKYASAGTVEFLVDDKTGDFFFLEANTRLQVEHGITEMCYGIDLVELMLQQADAELAGRRGLSEHDLINLQIRAKEPKGAAIEARIYCESPLRDYAPSPGLLQKVSWPNNFTRNFRVDTWVTTGTTVSANFDPLIAKVMYHSPDSRQEAIKGMHQALTASRICGPPTNLDFLAAIVKTEDFAKGNTLTSFLSTFKHVPTAIDVISGGSYTLIQDYPGRPSVGKGIPHSGAMDPIALRVANALVGNETGTEGLEITLSGPDLRFVGAATVALTGASMHATLDGQPFPMWTQVRIKGGQRLKIGKTTGGGCRSYLAVYGGFNNVAEYFDSKSTSPILALGGYQGRALAPGDMLTVTTEQPAHVAEGISLPEHLRPQYGNHYDILSMVGPHDQGYIEPKDIEGFYNQRLKVSHNASRSAIRLIGPVPKWSRKDGGEGGAHPSNVVEYGYPMGAVNWTGDDPCVFANDCPNFGGFLSSTTIIRADFSKMGQIKSGDTVQYRRVSLDEAIEALKMVEAFVAGTAHAAQGKVGFETVKHLETLSVAKSSSKEQWGAAIIKQIPQSPSGPLTTYRQGGDSNILVDYGAESFDLNNRVRVTLLEERLLSQQHTPEPIRIGIIATVGCCNSLNVTFDPLRLARADLLTHLQSLEASVGDLSKTKVPTRLFTLPITFESAEQDAATKRYMETQRPHAPYLPDNLAFVAENNAFTPDKLKSIYTSELLAAVVVGFYAGNTVSLPVDPRSRMSSPKANPSRVDTPAGTVGWGGSCCSIYPCASPGGYMMTGRTVPIWDAFGNKPGFAPGPAQQGGNAHVRIKGAGTSEHGLRPWLFNPLDLITFRRVSADEMDECLRLFDSGRYVFNSKPTTFSLEEHNALLEETAGEVASIRKRQHEAQAKMMVREEESLREWRAAKEKEKPDEGEVEKLMGTEGVEAVEAPVDANVWKVVAGEGAEVAEGDEVVVLEAMKLEVSVKLGGGQEEDEETKAKGGGPARKAVIEKVLVKQSETVKAGQRLVVVRWVGGI